MEALVSSGHTSTEVLQYTTRQAIAYHSLAIRRVSKDRMLEATTMRAAHLANDDEWQKYMGLLGNGKY
ncbi:MAG: hypothetical protein GQ570_03895 [Helicobacteraceae bacterium]|nr:hypothetical protein [Helicobacteraceae bacterium]